MSELKTIEERWQEFAAAVGLFDAPPVQVREMRNAFYAGFAAMFFVSRAIGEPEVSEARALQYLTERGEELDQFIESKAWREG